MGLNGHSFKQISILYDSLSSSGNAEKFYTDFYGLVPLKAEFFFPSISRKAATLLCTRVANRLISFYKENSLQKTTATYVQQPITDVEVCGLQYLGGYIFHKLHKRMKYKQRHDSEMCQSLAILEAAKATEIRDDHPQKLIECLDRGGLWKISITAQNMLSGAENVFRAHLSSQSNLKAINKSEILSKSLKNVDIKSNFTMLCESSSCKYEDSTAEDLLACILKLFIQVRCFSYAKDVVQKYKHKAKQGKAKALRSNLKQKYSEEKKSNEQKNLE